MPTKRLHTRTFVAMRECYLISTLSIRMICFFFFFRGDVDSARGVLIWEMTW